MIVILSWGRWTLVSHARCRLFRQQTGDAQCDQQPHIAARVACEPQSSARPGLWSLALIDSFALALTCCFCRATAAAEL